MLAAQEKLLTKLRDRVVIDSSFEQEAKEEDIENGDAKEDEERILVLETKERRNSSAEWLHKSQLPNLTHCDE